MAVGTSFVVTDALLSSTLPENNDDNTQEHLFGGRSVKRLMEGDIDHYMTVESGSKESEIPSCLDLFQSMSNSSFLNTSVEQVDTDFLSLDVLGKDNLDGSLQNIYSGLLDYIDGDNWGNNFGSSEVGLIKEAEEGCSSTGEGMTGNWTERLEKVLSESQCADDMEGLVLPVEYESCLVNSQEWFRNYLCQMNRKEKRANYVKITAPWQKKILRDVFSEKKHITRYEQLIISQKLQVPVFRVSEWFINSRRNAQRAVPVKNIIKKVISGKKSITEDERWMLSKEPPIRAERLSESLASCRRYSNRKEKRAHFVKITKPWQINILEEKFSQKNSITEEERLVLAEELRVSGFRVSEWFINKRQLYRIRKKNADRAKITVSKQEKILEGKDSEKTTITEDEQLALSRKVLVHASKVPECATKRVNLNKEQEEALRNSYKLNRYPNKKIIKYLAEKNNLDTKKIKQWFKDHRRRGINSDSANITSGNTTRKRVTLSTKNKGAVSASSGKTPKSRKMPLNDSSDASPVPQKMVKIEPFTITANSAKNKPVNRLGEKRASLGKQQQPTPPDVNVERVSCQPWHIEIVENKFARKICRYTQEINEKRIKSAGEAVAMFSVVVDASAFSLARGGDSAVKLSFCGLFSDLGVFSLFVETAHEGVVNDPSGGGDLGARKIKQLLCGQRRRGGDSDSANIISGNTKRKRVYLNKEQEEALRDVYKLNRYPNEEIVKDLIGRFNLDTKKIKQWFANQRRKKGIDSDFANITSEHSIRKRVTLSTKNKPVNRLGEKRASLGKQQQPTPPVVSVERVIYQPWQIEILENKFARKRKLCQSEEAELARTLQVSSQNVYEWFAERLVQARNNREKKKRNPINIKRKRSSVVVTTGGNTETTQKCSDPECSGAASIARKRANKGVSTISKNSVRTTGFRPIAPKINIDYP